MNQKELIDSLYHHPAMRKLSYWRYSNHDECSAEISDTFCAGNQDFANAVLELLDYAEELEGRCLPL